MYLIGWQNSIDCVSWSSKLPGILFEKDFYKQKSLFLKFQFGRNVELLIALYQLQEDEGQIQWLYWGGGVQENITLEIILEFQNIQKMGLTILLSFVFFTIIAVAFPTTPTHSIFLPFSLTSNTLLDTLHETTNGNAFLYVPYISFTRTTYGICKYYVSGASAVLLEHRTKILGQTATSPILSLTGPYLMLSYDIAGSTSRLLNLDKDNFATLTNQTTLKRVGGIYLPTYDFLFYHINNQNLVKPTLGGYNHIYDDLILTTSSPQTTQYLYNPTYQKLYRFYNDSNIFQLNRLYPSQAQMVIELVNILNITIIPTGYQCVCLSYDKALIYILDKLAVIRSYNFAGGPVTFMALDPTIYTGITGCYHEGATNSLVMYKSTNQNILHKYDVGTRMPVGSISTSFTHFHIDPTCSYLTALNGTHINVYQIGPNPEVICSSGQFYNQTTTTCDPCPTGCSICTSVTHCYSCGTNYTLTNNLCVSNTTNITDTTSQNQTQTLSTLQTVLSSLITNDGVTVFNKVPGGRKMMPFLCFLINIDELWLYQYHERDYGRVMNNFFESLQQLENEKWNILEEETTEVIYEKLGTSREGINEAVDTKFNYTSPTFLKREGRGETFLPACWEFLTFNLIFTLLFFVLLRWGFKMLFNHRISILLRGFSSFVLLAPLLLDGNLQYFCFLLFTQISKGFSLNPRDKMLTALNYLIYFFVVWFSVVTCFLTYYLNKKLAKYVLVSWRSRIHGLLAYSLTNAVRMLLFGALHSLLRNHDSQLPSLIAAELVYILSLLLSMKFWRVHKVAFKVWFSVIFSLLRVCLQSVLLFQQSQGLTSLSGSAEQELIEVMISILMVAYLLSFYVGTAWELVYEIIDILTPSKTPKDKEKDKPKEKEKIKSKVQKEKQARRRNQSKSKAKGQGISKKGGLNQSKGKKKEQGQSVAKKKGQSKFVEKKGKATSVNKKRGQDPKDNKATAEDRSPLQDNRKSKQKNHKPETTSLPKKSALKKQLQPDSPGIKIKNTQERTLNKNQLVWTIVYPEDWKGSRLI